MLEAHQSNYVAGQAGGVENVTLAPGQMPAHIGEQIRAYAIWQMRKAMQIKLSSPVGTSWEQFFTESSGIFSDSGGENCLQKFHAIFRDLFLSCIQANAPPPR